MFHMPHMYTFKDIKKCVSRLFYLMSMHVPTGASTVQTGAGNPGDHGQRQQATGAVQLLPT